MPVHALIELLDDLPCVLEFIELGIEVRLVLTYVDDIGVRLQQSFDGPLPPIVIQVDILWCLLQFHHIFLCALLILGSSVSDPFMLSSICQ